MMALWNRPAIQARSGGSSQQGSSIPVLQCRMQHGEGIDALVPLQGPSTPAHTWSCPWAVLPAELGSHRGFSLGLLWGWQGDSWECKGVLLEATKGCCAP